MSLPASSHNTGEILNYLEFTGKNILFVKSLGYVDFSEVMKRTDKTNFSFIEDLRGYELSGSKSKDVQSVIAARPVASATRLRRESLRVKEGFPIRLRRRNNKNDTSEAANAKTFCIDFSSDNIHMLGIEKNAFDYIVFKNSLETLYDPWTWLSDVRPYVKPDGTVLVEITNIRNMNVFSSLVNGYFTYSDEGMITFDKLRFFTPAELLIHAVNAGYDIVDVRHFADASLAGQLQVVPGEAYKFQGNNFVLNDIPGESLMEMFSDRVVILLKKRGSGKGFASPLRLQKPPDYFGNPRFDLIEMMDKPPEAILEIGCGIGTTCGAIKSMYPGCRTIGIDIDDKSIQKAGTLIDNAITADIEKVELSKLGIGEESLDYILYGDLLEHLRNPWEILRKHKKYLKPGGQILASIPNIRHNSVLLSLLYGRWTYASSGILDVTHLRFFTLREIKRLFQSAGLHVYDIKGSPDIKPEDLRLPPEYAQFSFNIQDMTLQNVPREEVPEFSIIQFLVKAGKKGKTDRDS